MELDDDEAAHLEEQSFTSNLREHKGHRAVFLLLSFAGAVFVGFYVKVLAAIFLFGFCLLGVGVTTTRGASQIARVGSGNTREGPSRIVAELQRRALRQRRYHARIAGVVLIARTEQADFGPFLLAESDPDERRIDLVNLQLDFAVKPGTDSARHA